MQAETTIGISRREFVAGAAAGLAAAGKTSEARRIYERLQSTRTDNSEQHIREAARRGLAALA